MTVASAYTSKDGFEYRSSTRYGFNGRMGPYIWQVCNEVRGRNMGNGKQYSADFLRNDFHLYCVRAQKAIKLEVTNRVSFVYATSNYSHYRGIANYDEWVYDYLVHRIVQGIWYGVRDSRTHYVRVSNKD